MEKRELFQRVFVEGKESNLPKEELTYFCYHKNGRMSEERFYKNSPWPSWWIENIDSYLQPIEAEEEEELLNYILDIDFLTTSEFCKKYNVPEPVFTGEVQSSARQFLQIDAIKHKMFVEKAKEIRRRYVLSRHSEGK